MKTLTLSVITINLNNAPGLQKTLDSLYSQSFKDFEHIIIDGKSADGSLEIIKKHLDKITYWVSETDKGIYHAMNKGILKASGTYCVFLNSGDILYNADVLNKINQLTLTGDIVCFNAMVGSGENTYELVPAPQEISFYLFYKHTIIHQSTLIKRDLFLRYGLYNENLKIVADWEFFIRAFFLHQASFKSYPFIISIFDATGISSQPENYATARLERAEILSKYFYHFLPDYAVINDKPVYTFLKYLNGHGFIKSMYVFKFRVFNKIAKILTRKAGKGI